MNSSTAPTLAAIIIQLGLGLLVFQANPKRASNQCFLLLSLAIGIWLASLYITFTAKSASVAEFGIRQASVAGALMLLSFKLSRLSIREREKSWPRILRNSRTWLVITFGIIIYCQTKIFLKGAQMPHLAGGAPTAIYGKAAAWIYLIYVAAGFTTLILSYCRDMKKASSGERAELAFILVGGIATIAISLLLTFILDAFIEQSRWMWFAPFRMIIFSGVVAYGIATRKMMDVGRLVRRTMSYILLGAYLLALYAAVWWLVATVLRSTVANAYSIAHVAAAVVIAFPIA